MRKMFKDMGREVSIEKSHDVQFLGNTLSNKETTKHYSGPMLLLLVSGDSLMSPGHIPRSICFGHDP